MTTTVLRLIQETIRCPAVPSWTAHVTTIGGSHIPNRPASRRC
jgi:hypothetical protein